MLGQLDICGMELSVGLVIDVDAFLDLAEGLAQREFHLAAPAILHPIFELALEEHAAVPGNEGSAATELIIFVELTDIAAVEAVSIYVHHFIVSFCDSVYVELLLILLRPDVEHRYVLRQ